MIVKRDLSTNQARPMDIITDAFCASGMHFPNGSWVTFGGNGAVGPGGNMGSVVGPTGTGARHLPGTLSLYAHICACLGFYDATYKDYDGENAVRILNPCSAGDPESACTWYDNSTKLMKRRWYSTAEPLANGTIVILGGFVNGGYINRYEHRGHAVITP